MTKLDEETALAILFSNIKRKNINRSMDLLTIAKSCKYLVDLYGTQKLVAEKVGLSTEMIRELLLPLKLPKEIQNLISYRKIDSIDIIKQISEIKGSSKQIIAALSIKDTTLMTSKDIRDMMRLIKKSNISIDDAEKIIKKEKPESLHLFIIDFEEEMYDRIKKEAKKHKLSPADLVKLIITDWLKKHSK